MKLFNKIYIICFILFCQIFFVCTAFAANSDSKNAPITNAFLALYADPEAEVRLGAMLVSAHAGFHEWGLLVNYIKKHRYSAESPVERTFKNYAVALLQGCMNEDDNLKFVMEFPNNKDDLTKLFTFESKFKAPPTSYLLEQLLIFAYSGGTEPYNLQAKKTIKHLQKVIGDWGFYGTQLNTFDEAADANTVWEDTSSDLNTKAPIPAGDYTITEMRTGFSDNRYKGKNGAPWFCVLIPEKPNSRIGLGIHPDGGTPGTEGCIGIGYNSDTEKAKTQLKASIGTKFIVKP